MDKLVFGDNGKDNAKMMKWLADYYSGQLQKGLPGVKIDLKRKSKVKTPYLKTRTGEVLKKESDIKAYVSGFVPYVMSKQQNSKKPEPAPKQRTFNDDEYDLDDIAMNIAGEAEGDDPNDDTETKRDLARVKAREKEFEARYKKSSGGGGASVVSEKSSKEEDEDDYEIQHRVASSSRIEDGIEDGSYDINDYLEHEINSS
jgi:hypothetical protein